MSLGVTTNSLIIRDFFGKKMLILKGLFFEDKFYNNIIILMAKYVINVNEKFLSFALYVHGVGRCSFSALSRKHFITLTSRHLKIRSGPIAFYGDDSVLVEMFVVRKKDAESSKSNNVERAR